MKTFQQYVIEQGNDLSTKDSHGALMKVARIACEDHHDELLDFFQSLAVKDHRIQQELDAYNRDVGNSHAKHKGGHLPPYADDDDKDTIVPSGADNLGGYEPGEG